MLSENFKAQMSEMKLIFERINQECEIYEDDFESIQGYQNLLQRIFLIVDNESKLEKEE